MAVVLSRKPGGGGGGGAPSGPAGGDLAGTYPNPTISSSYLAGFHGCRVLLSANITIVDGFSFNSVSFDAEEFDTDAYHTAGSSTRLTVPAGLGGYYLSVAQYNVTTSTAGDYGIAIRKNGGGFDFVAEQQFGTVGQVHATVNASGPVHLNASDYVEMLVVEKTGGNLTIDKSATFFSLIFLGT